MKYVYFLLVYGLLFAGSPVRVSAHSGAQPSFFSLNGVFTGFYPVLSVSADSPDFQIPQDIAPRTYITGEPIQFAIDENILMTILPPDIVEKTRYVWDFGDGTKGTGQTNSHIYTRAGSYFLTVTGEVSTADKNQEPIQIQSMLLHVLPDKNYQLPKAVISVNGREPVWDPETGTVQSEFPLNLKNSVHLAVKLSPPENPKSVVWDFGDGASGRDPVTDHTYNPIPDRVFPAVRVVTNDGYILDTFVSLKNDSLAEYTRQKSGPDTMIKSYLLISGIVAAVIWGIVSVFKIRKNRPVSD